MARCGTWRGAEHGDAAEAGAAILALAHDLKPDPVAQAVGIGIPLALATATLWRQVLSLLS